MAIAFAHVSIHSRAKGESAVAAAAYRSGVCLTDNRTGIVYDFTHRKDVIFSELLLPESTLTDFKERQLLWNAVETCEKRKDAQVCKDIVLALPKELDTIQHIELAKRFAQTHFVDNGIPADIAIHDHGDGNPHAHILITTRRLEKNRFSKYKARDLNPQFYNSNVVEKEIWGEKWRSLQNDFFKDHNIDLSVDLNHIIPERHEGKVRGESAHYIQEENELIREAREEIALFNIDNLVNHLSLTSSVFSRRDIERLIFKTITNKDDKTHFLNCVEQILHHKDVIKLGVNDRGIDSYTTRNHYLQEAKLLDNVMQLQTRTNHVYDDVTDELSKHHNLDNDQSAALSFITQGEDISVLVGRPGAGKSYLLKPVKDYYQKNNCTVLGAALSGKVAKSLEADTGIPSSTIASLTYRLSKQQLKLTKDHILVIDEAGMVDFANMAYLLNAANKACAKIILVGDPDQLKPINKGEIFRGIIARTGYIELDNIRRQLDPGDAKASLLLANGRIAEAIHHYSEKGAIHFSNNPHDASTKMVEAWSVSLADATSMKEHVMLAFTRAAVTELNEKARVLMQSIGHVYTENFSYFSENGEQPIDLAQGERILLRQNDKALGVRNGDLATITAIDGNQFTATLDSGETVIMPKSYKFIEYGYALTVHKSQGMTVDNASVLIDSTYWDRFLSFVAMTRHRKSLTLFADITQHPSLERLTQTLSRSSTRDNVIDWPLDYAIRCGFEPDSLIGRAINRIAGVANQVKEKWNYLVRYEAYLKASDVQHRVAERESLRAVASVIAGYMDEKSTLSKYIASLKKDAKQQGIELSTMPAFEDVYKRSLARDKHAHDLLSSHGHDFEKLKGMTAVLDAIKHDAARYERYLTIQSIATLPPTANLPEVLIAKAFAVDLKKDYVHMVRLAAEHNKPVSSLYQKVDVLQKTYRQMLFNELKKEHPILNEYDKLFNEGQKAYGFKREQLNRALLITARTIVGDRLLYDRLQRDLPKFAKSLATRVREHGKDRDIER